MLKQKMWIRILWLKRFIVHTSVNLNSFDSFSQIFGPASLKPFKQAVPFSSFKFKLDKSVCFILPQNMNLLKSGNLSSFMPCLMVLQIIPCPSSSCFTKISLNICQFRVHVSDVSVKMVLVLLAVAYRWPYMLYIFYVLQTWCQKNCNTEIEI